jgi:hypothetical protein
MKRLLLFVVPAIVLLTFSTSMAEDKFDPAARAKTIAPFIDEQTLVVMHVDLTRFKLDVLFDKQIQLVPALKEVILREKIGAVPQAEAFIKAGGKDIYGVIQTPTPMGPPYRFLVIPVGPGVDERAITENEMFIGTSFKRSGDLLVGGLVSGPEVSSKPELLSRLGKTPPDQRPELALAFEAAGDTAAQVLLLPPKYVKRVIEETMPQLPKEIGGGSSSVVTQGCLWAALGFNVEPNLMARLIIQSQDAAAAAALNKKLAEVWQNVAQLPAVKKDVPKMSEAVELLTPNAEGDRLVLVFDEQQKEIGKLFNLILAPALLKARMSAQKKANLNNMKYIGLAMHSYHDAKKHFPAAAIYSPDGKPLLSWRVMVLPWLDQHKLYDQFHLDEPWDSPNNRKLIDKMPDVFKSLKSTLKEPGKTNFVVPVGPGTVFEGREGMPIKDITDGTARTVMLVEVDDAHAVTWTKPDDLPYNPKEPAKGLFVPGQEFFCALYCDGSVHIIKLPRKDEELRAVFSANGEDPSYNLD